jgi:hypothetical protein
MNVRLLLVFLGIFIASPLRATDTVLLADRLTDDNHANQSLPNSARWFYAGGSGGVTNLWSTPPVTTGALRMIAEGNVGSSAMALTYFTAAGSPRSLAPGESLTVEFTLWLDAVFDSANNLRFAVLDSENVRPSGDSFSGIWNDIYANRHDGYQVAFNTGATSSGFNIYRRYNSGAQSPFDLASNNLLGGDNSAVLNLPVKSAFPVRLVITRSTGAGTTMTLAATVNGVTVTRTDSSANRLASFDCLGVMFSDKALREGQELRIDNVTVRHATAADPAVVTTLLDSAFADDKRSTQSLPASSKWFYGGQGPVARHLTASGGALRMDSDASSAMALAYFKALDPENALNSVQSLQAGESLTIRFNLFLGALSNSNDNLRFAVLNSRNQRPSGDSLSGTEDSLYSENHDGYQVSLNTGASSSAFNIHKRATQATPSPFALGTRLGTANSSALGLPVNTAIPVQLVLTRSTGGGTSLTIAATVNGVTVTRTDSAGPVTGFDCLGIMISDTALPENQNLRIDDVTVRHATADASPVTTTLLNDAFADNDRGNQSLPSSARWFHGTQTADRLTTDSLGTKDNLVFTPGGVNAMAFAYFTAPGSPRTLAIGESLNVQANIRPDVLTDFNEGVRFGLFNSQGVRATADITPSLDSATFNTYRGYFASLNLGSSGGFNLRRRGVDGTNPFSVGSSTVLGAGNPVALGLSTSPKRVARISFTVTRISSTSVRIESAINGRGVVRIDPSPVATSFDTVGIFFHGNAFYNGPQIDLDNITVIHVAAPPAITSAGAILSQTFEDTSWSSAAFAGTGATGSVTQGEHGTINVRGSVVPSGGLRLALDSTGASGTWSGTLDSGALTVTNSETNLGKLTLAFDLLASSAHPVRVRLEAGGGILERLIFPFAPNAYQRIAFELSDMDIVSGTFNPAAANIKLSLAIDGGFDSPDAWPAGAHYLQIDNVYYARPAYYVKPGGNDNLDGRTEANALANISTALSRAGPGDIILMMEGSSPPAYSLSNSLAFSRGGFPAGWLTLKNYPGHRPLIQRLEPTGGSYNAISIARGSSDSIDTTSSLNYIELRGFRLRGTADTLADADKGGRTAKSNMNAIAYDGRYMALPSHHIRVADTEVSNFAGGGIIGIDTDWVYLENNDVHDNCNWTIYAPSGLSQLRPYNFDGTGGTHRIFWVGNRLYRNETKIEWEFIGRISDGNGAILDTFLDTPYGAYLGRSLVANNLFYRNGGSGIHCLDVDGADIVHNTAYYNSASPSLKYSSIYASSSNDIIIANNIIVAGPGEPINGSPDRMYTPSYPRTTGVLFLNNIYYSADGSATPYTEPGASGNITATSAAQVGLVDPDNGDFRLRTGSLAFNAATTAITTAPRRDFHKLTRGASSTPSIGAIERQPVMLTAPAGATLNQGGATTFSVTAQSAGPGSSLAYQWQKNGVNLSGQTAAQLVIANAVPAQAGAYRVRVAHLVNGVEVDAIVTPAVTLNLNGVDWITNSIPLVNPGFESSLGYLGGTVSTVPGWTVSNGGAYGSVAANTNSALFTSGVTGSNVLFPGGGLTQTIGSTYVKDVTYILTIDAGQPLGVSGATGFLYGFRTDNTAVSYGFKPVGNGSAFVGTFPAAGTMQTYSLAYTATATDAGQPIKIGFYDYFASEPRFRLDNVTLTYSSTFTQLQTWRQTRFGQTDNTGTAADTADPDGDGVANLLEYALGGDPLQGSNAILPVVSSVNGRLQLTFLRARADVTYTVQGSSDLVTWADLATNPDAVSTTTPVVFTDSVSNPSRRFLRLKITVP